MKRFQFCKVIYGKRITSVILTQAWAYLKKKKTKISIDMSTDGV